MAGVLPALLFLPPKNTFFYEKVAHPYRYANRRCLLGQCPNRHDHDYHPSDHHDACYHYDACYYHDHYQPNADCTGLDYHGVNYHDGKPKPG